MNTGIVSLKQEDTEMDQNYLTPKHKKFNHQIHEELSRQNAVKIGNKADILYSLDLHPTNFEKSLASEGI